MLGLVPRGGGGFTGHDGGLCRVGGGGGGLRLYAHTKPCRAVEAQHPQAAEGAAGTAPVPHVPQSPQRPGELGNAPTRAATSPGGRSGIGWEVAVITPYPPPQFHSCHLCGHRYERLRSGPASLWPLGAVRHFTGRGLGGLQGSRPNQLIQPIQTFPVAEKQARGPVRLSKKRLWWGSVSAKNSGIGPDVGAGATPRATSFAIPSMHP
mmetsp:Transcript_125430/g.217474  ORF Transcript_125430/g.217474 Transcript_125430/m.217474 type:complete len:208 (-) Transcript_125430:813-1436(-)